MRTASKVSIIIFFLCTSSLPALSFSENNHIIHAIKEASRKADIGIKLRNLKTGKIIYQQNEDRYYTFASSLKMITVFSLLKYFGSDYLFSSKLFQKHQNYYLDINDPDFSTADLEFLISKIKEVGITSIKGNFYVVDNRFTIPQQGEGRMIDDGSYCYGAPITKMHINKNCVKLIAKPAVNLNKPIHIEGMGVIPYKIINKTHTIPAHDWPRIKTVIEKDKLIILGTLNRSSEEIIIGAVVNDSFNHMKNMIREILLKNNIVLSGQILLSKTPPQQASLITSINKSFSQIASHALKRSDNFITDYMLAEFGSRYAAQDWRNCGALLKQFISQEFNVDLSRSTIVDGSGLSRYNLLTVNQFDDFLSSLYNLPDFNKFLPILARPGEDGTLKERFEGVRIFAKTGGMTGISSLVGYIFDKNNTVYSFVIVANNYYGPRKKYSELQETIIKFIVPK